MLIKYTGVRPVQTRNTDAGFDLVTSDDTFIDALGFTSVPTGTRILIPEGYYGRITHRSSVLRRGIEVQDGTIDAGYTGELVVMARALDTSEPVLIEKGVRIAQIIFAPVVQVSWKAEDFLYVEGHERGERGWGSSGS